ncbi:squamosa promoter-binding-like protein 7 [Juglans microcarpa x Juglans regia]|uniref:squamosa promoter-binding-like protein 7 n=1 Tax=Juglans microcarpa x Juglans regia TaxID=2249226 RepID=UPI001B7DB919|nr:squamosa promoter-binding-like protein 7 [Juglans microcarpa x Juglans regia]
MESPSRPQQSPNPRVSEEMEDPSSDLWDFSELLDFTVDEHFSVSLDPDDIHPHPIPQEDPAAPTSNRIRKRDPRLICSNFLAGRIPCACPELDEMMEMEMEEDVHGKKRARSVRTSTRRPRAAARCQVPGCETDISELKGYHRRHRVCLRCAHATTVVLDGVAKRYCQQCGKFHILSDFDEGKRSCRRKLERHNVRRRRKPSDSRVAAYSEPEGAMQSEHVPCDGEAEKDGLCSSSPMAEMEAVLESEDVRVTTLCSDLNSQNMHCDTVASFVASGETQMHGEKDNTKCSLSPLYCDNKTDYSSVCPTGRISFKLYDWNPAEFPRRLRHQIFQWLSSMPVELEGYIRPGCTILTVFIAMPMFMWTKLSKDPLSYLHDFVISPGRMLSGRGTILVFINDKIFRVMKGGTSVMKVKVEVRAPRLHYVHPICFEAGKPLEFVACGSNLLQSKLRFLVSFAGKYLALDYCVSSLHGQTEGDTASSCNHQLFKIFIPWTEKDLFGPAFVEVENESGLSNFIPILIGDKEICNEVEMLQQKVDASLFLKGSDFAAIVPPSDASEVFALRQSTFDEFLLDIAWLLKQPASENFQHSITATRIQRLNNLLSFLISNDSTTILEKLLEKLKIVLSNMNADSMVNGNCDADLGLLEKYIDNARDNLHRKYKKSGSLVLQSEYVPEGEYVSQSRSKDNELFVSVISQDTELVANARLGVQTCSTSSRSRNVPLLNREVVMKVNHIKGWPRKSCGRIGSGAIFSSRPGIFVISFGAACLGICAILLHPHKAGEFAVSIRRCLFNRI